jgi:hypothetical protein
MELTIVPFGRGSPLGGVIAGQVGIIQRIGLDVWIT